jgi:hypothetical protein
MSQLHEAVGTRELQLRLDMKVAEVASLHECNIALQSEVDRLHLQSRYYELRNPLDCACE